MDGTDHSEELHLQRLNALCRLCGRKSDKAFDAQKIILCKTYATELYAFHQIDTLFDTASTHSETLCRPCYMPLMRLKCFQVPSDFTLQAAKEDIGKSSSIWSELILSYLQISALCVPRFLTKQRVDDPQNQN